MTGFKLVCVLLLWTIYVAAFVRSLLQRRTDRPLQLFIWQMLFLAGLAFTFTGIEVEQATDRLFGGLPVSIYIKYFALTQGIYLYYRVLHTVNPGSPGRYRLLREIHPFVIGGGFISFALIVLLDQQAAPQIRYYVCAVRDSVVALYMLLGVMPVNQALLDQETVPTMRVKHTLNLALCLFYVLVAISSLVSLVVVIVDPVSIDALLPVFLPLTYLVYFCFLSVLVPHQWIAVLLLPARFITYLRLCQLRHDVERLSPAHANFAAPRVRWYTAAALERAIYQSVIFILDHAPQLSRSNEERHLSNQLAALLKSELDYPALVNRMARLKYDRPRA